MLPHLCGPIWVLVHDWHSVHRDDCRWVEVEGIMGSFGVIMFPPALDDDLGFTERVEDFAA